MIQEMKKPQTHTCFTISSDHNRPDAIEADGMETLLRRIAGRVSSVQDFLDSASFRKRAGKTGGAES